ncbi:Beta-ketoacyl-ACP synthase II [Candidatus Trichorickettsia mobilis]|uniref:3-oxoacyl-[acyl-carrier-protein] synthase 2 n=1 Tax=Candidatus Trichorickettsia mobilis TaxID=1346319 RepID=A0ABZ0UVL5_9RICK|nr:beta-ketoacyl-ACP synthase II [Candidatus Trichorickettsia mobilis]WPY01225.1 Beta-ketoacyl-ACP synthase II [Candidatus Trichorickettsia mobilis]
MSERRVVITGIGLVTPLGINVDTSWSAILQGKSGVKKITKFDTSYSSCKIAGLVDDNSSNGFNPERVISARDVRKMDVFIQYGIDAAVQAVEDSGWKPEDEMSRDRTGLILGSGIGGLKMIEETAIAFHQSSNKKVSPYFIPASLINLLSGHVAIKYGFTGPNHAVVTACSTGANAIGDASRIIKYGDADVMVAGGAEAPITPIGLAGFAAAKALSTRYNDTPEIASRPWDQERDGFIMGEGAGVVVLEEYAHAKARGAKIYAEIIGYGLTGDAYHITSPHPEGRGAYRAMSNALSDAKITTADIDYINAHGTSTPPGDAIELAAVERLFANYSNKILMSSTKSATGHLLGAAGSVELIFSILSMRDQVAPPTLNLHNPITTPIDLVPIVAKPRKINYVLSNSFGFGGTNASLVIKKL